MNIRSLLKFLLLACVSLPFASPVRAQSLHAIDSDSEQALKSAIADAEQNDPGKVPGALTNLASFYRHAGRYAEAEMFYTMVVEQMRDSATGDFRQ
jgi:hypothetical protein